MTETGMSIFEHSLAFAEAEAMLSNRLGLTLFGSIGSKATTQDEVTKFFAKSEILEKMNTPPEVRTFFWGGGSFYPYLHHISGYCPFHAPKTRLANQPST